MEVLRSINKKLTQILKIYNLSSKSLRGVKNTQIRSADDSKKKFLRKIHMWASINAEFYADSDSVDIKVIH